MAGMGRAIFLSYFICAMKYKYYVWQFKRSFCKSRRSQQTLYYFGLLVKLHLFTHTVHITWQSGRHRKSFTRRKNLLNVERRLSHVCVFLFTDDLKDKCEKLLCKCDRDAAKCLRKAPFIKKYALWPDFLCGFKQPMCSIY